MSAAHHTSQRTAPPLRKARLKSESAKTSRFIRDRSRPRYVPGTRITVRVPIGSNADLLKFRASRFYSHGGVQGMVVGGVMLLL